MSTNPRALRMEVPGYRELSTLFRSPRTTVFSAVRIAGNQRVVLKTVTPGAPDQRARWRLQHEYLLLSELHEVPGLIRTGGLIATIHGTALELELVGSGDLSQLTEQVVPVARAIDIGVQLADTVAALHSHGVSHRDINPSNVRYHLASGELWLIDFGLATKLEREVREMRPSGRLEGTLGYLSPEQTGRMNRSVDRRTDLYSLGATLYQVLLGRPPFANRDDLELIHATVAIQPMDPRQMRPEIPDALAEIVLKLLQKDAEDRYQLASAVADDLRHCREQLDTQGRIAPFALGQTDARGTFLIPERLVGREAEVAELADALARTVSGRASVIGIEGPTGVGKTALTRELLPLLTDGGLLASGVCDPVNRTPYGPLLQILRTVYDTVLAGDPAHIDRHRARYEQAIDGQGALLRRLLPELEAILGPQGEIPELPPSEAQKRVLRMLVRLLRAYHDPDHELVLFLDDLQWADGPTLDVIDLLLHDTSGGGGPLIVLAWRGDEVDADHPLTTVLERHDAQIQHLRPEPLCAEHVAELLADTLSSTPDLVQTLADRVFEKTAGNAYFVRRFLTGLARDGLLSFDEGTRTWVWSLPAIDAMGPTPNVAALIERQLAELGPSARTVLGAAACVGKRVPLAMLQRVALLEPDALQEGLTEAVGAGLLQPVDDTWNALVAAFAHAKNNPEILRVTGAVRFAHDTVHAAALELPEPDEQLQHHLRAGRHMLAVFDRDQTNPFDAADQLNRATALLAGRDERRQVAALNLAAGTRAADSAAFSTAVHYLEAGIALLDPSDWDLDYDLCFGLHLAAAESWLMCPEHRPAVDFTGVALARARDVQDRVAVQRVQIRFHTGRYEFDDTIRLTLEALGWVGVSIPARPTLVQAVIALLRTAWRVRGLDADAVLALPDCTDPQVIAALELMMDAAAPSYYISDNLLPIFLCRMLELSAVHGLSAGASFAAAGYGFLQIATRDDVDRAVMWADAARRIVDRFDATLIEPRVTLLCTGFVDTRTRPLGTLIQPFLEAAWRAREVGDAEYTALCHFNRSLLSSLAGVELHEAVRRAEVDLAACREMAQTQSVNAMRSIRQTLACMLGDTDDPAELRGEFMDYDGLLDEMRTSRDRSGPPSVYYRQTQLLLLFSKDTPRLMAEVAKGEAAIAFTPGSPDVGPFLFHAALARCRRLRESGSRSWSELRKIRAHLKILRRWEQFCPANCAHRVRLIEAELADLAGDLQPAIRAYDESIRLARASGILHEEAICAQWAARAALRHGHDRNAAALLLEARAAWQSYGCTPMLPQLAELEAELHGSAPLLAEISRSTQTRSTSQTDARSYDASAVLRAARALSSIIELDALIESLMRSTVQSAGGTGGMLVLFDEGQPLVAATATVSERGIEITLLDRDDPTAPDLLRPDLASVIEYAIRRRAPVAVHDGAADPRFFQGLDDPPRSALCVPALKGSALVAVMYVENRLARHAFTDDRHEVVELLCAQAAISVENAQLYGRLQQSLDQQTQLTRAYGRFMPPQFLELLSKSSILDLHLGDQVSQDVTVMFADIREFTGLAEAMGPKRTFAFINRYLGEMEPAIHAHNGFVNQYLGDGIMAIFPGSADDALGAALAMLDGLVRLNAELHLEQRPAVRIGIGLNTGPLMLGAIGGADRMGRGCVGDVTNVASRIEGMTKVYDVPLLISDATQAALTPAHAVELREVERVQPRGRAEAITVFEVVEGTLKMRPPAETPSS